MLLDEDEGTDADFDAGYADTKTKAPEVAEASKETTTPPAVVAPAVTEVVPAAPEYVQLTKTEHEELKAALAKTAVYDKQLASINGSIGYLKQNIVKPAADATAGQQPVKEGAETTPPADADTVGRQRASEAIIEHEMAVLAAEYPNWREIVGAPEKTGVENVDKNNPFRVWLAAQTAEYQAKINGANSSIIIMKAIDKFNEHKAAKPAATVVDPKIAARKNVIRDAQQPRGDGGQPAPAKTEDDAFAEGFAAG